MWRFLFGWAWSNGAATTHDDTGTDNGNGKAEDRHHDREGPPEHLDWHKRWLWLEQNRRYREADELRAKHKKTK